MRFFIPEEKKKYILTEDWQFLLYPFNWNFSHKFLKLMGTGLHGIKTDTNFTYDDPFKYCKFTDPEWNSSNGKCVVDWFLLTDMNYPDSVSKLIRAYQDLEAFGSMDNVILIYTEWAGRGKNKTYTVFTKGSYYRNPTRFPRIQDNLRFSKDIESRLKLAENYWNGEMKEKLAIYRNCMKLNPIWDKEIKGNIPIYHTLKSGTIITIKNLVYKDKNLNSIKDFFVKLIVDDEELIITKDDFNNIEVNLL